MTRRARGASRAARSSALAALAAVAVLLLGAGPASAHAELDSTSPAEGSEVATAPDAVVLTFDEGVGVSPRSITVRDARGARVDSGAVTHPGGDTRVVSVPLALHLARGSYVVVWHVVSDDSHPASGTFTFGLGVPAAHPAAAPAGDRLLAVLHVAAGFLAIAGTVVLLGAAFFFSVLWPRGVALARSRRLLVRAWAVSAVGTLALLVLEGPYGASRSFGAVTDGSLLADTLATTYGKLLVLRLLALAAAVPLWRAATRREGLPGRVDLAGLALLVVESFSFAGHAGQGSWVPLASTMDALHVAAASLWLGGLVVLGVVLLGRRGDPGVTADLGTVLPRWSRVAMAAVLVLVLTGAYQAWREVGGWDALVATAYGRLVLAKVGVLALMLVLASYGRRWILRHRRPARGAPAPAAAEPALALSGPAPVDGGAATAARGLRPAGEHRAGLPERLPGRADPAPAAVGVLRRSVAAEAGLGAVVLALTSVLVTTVPARQAYVPTFATSLVARSPGGESARVAVVVRPTSAGYEGISIRAETPAGRPLPLQRAAASFTNPGQGIGPIPLDLVTTSAGRIEDVLISVPAPGWWQVTLSLTAGGHTYAASLGYTVG